jgi:hypothetical protein
VNIADVATPQQFWTLIDSIHKDAWESGMTDYYGDDAGPMVRWFNGQACNVYDDTVDLPDEVE